MLNWFKGKSLEEQLNATKKIRVQGVNFRIRKINSLDHLTGARVMLEMYELYKAGDKKVSLQSGEKIKTHYRDIIMSGVMYPKLCRKKDDKEGGVWVEGILNNWGFTSQLYDAIVLFTYGKKKIAQYLSQESI